MLEQITFESSGAAGSALEDVMMCVEPEMQIDLRREDAEMLRDLLRQRIVELDKEINRTDSVEFKHELHLLDRAIERVVVQLSSALEGEGEGQAT